MAHLLRLAVGGALLTAATVCVFFSVGIDRVVAADKAIDAISRSGDDIAGFWSGRISAGGGRPGGLRRLVSLAGDGASGEAAAKSEGVELGVSSKAIMQEEKSEEEPEAVSESDSSMRTAPAGTLNASVAGAPRAVEEFNEKGLLKRGPQRPVRSKGKRNLLPRRRPPGQGPAVKQGGQDLALVPVIGPKPWGAELRLLIAKVLAICAALAWWTPLAGVAALSAAVGAVVLARRGLRAWRRRRAEARAALLPKRTPLGHSSSDSTIGTESVGGDVELGVMAQSSTA